MSYLALYRKWRPMDFKGLVGQDAIVRTLKNALTKERVSHAYLFSGVRGTGKTSTAKLLSKAVNCLDLRDGEPCNQCENCVKINEGTFMDLIEIDAASNRGIDEIRDLREKIKFHPVEGKVKVYIIDEVHMLTGEAFNALLKTLEEPPGHVVFILATTEPQKIPLTILSRCQRFDFHKIPNDILKSHLKMIGEDSGATLTDEALNLMTKLAGGGLRDGISLLDQCITSSDGTITGEQVAAVSGIVDDETLMSLLKTIGEGALSETIREYELLKEKGKSIGQLLKDLMEAFKNMLLLKTVKDATNYIVASEEAILKYEAIGSSFSKNDLLEWVYMLGELESQLKYSTHPDILLEVALVRGIAKDEDGLKFEVKPEQVVAKEEASAVKAVEVPKVVEPVAAVEMVPEGIVEPAIETPEAEPLAAVETAAEEISEPVVEKVGVFEEEVAVSRPVEGNGQALWQKFLEALKKEKPLSYPFYVEGEVSGVNGNKLVIVYDEKYTFHKERGETEKHKANAEAVLSQVSGNPMKVILEFKTVEVKEEVSVEDKIKDIFGDDVTFIDS